MKWRAHSRKQPSSGTLLHSADAFQGGAVRDRKPRALQDDEMFSFELAKRPRHCLARRSNELGNFLVC
jgi:hypothetical protein